MLHVAVRLLGSFFFFFFYTFNFFFSSVSRGSSRLIECFDVLHATATRRFIELRLQFTNRIHISSFFFDVVLFDDACVPLRLCCMVVDGFVGWLDMVCWVVGVM